MCREANTITPNPASIDPLTGLPNRQSLQARLNDVIQEKAQSHGEFGLLFIGIDRFHAVNETFGHAAGDCFLRLAGERMSKGLGSKGTLARFGGDEFIALIPQVKEEAELLQTAGLLKEALQTPLYINGCEIYASISIGAGLYPLCGQDKITLMKNANIALHSAKKMGKGQVQVYEPWMNKDTFSRFVLTSEFHQALMRNEFVLHYQPRLNLQTQTIECFEALVRWNHPQRGIIPPLEFIPLAEETGFIVTLGQWVLDEACRQAACWQAEGEPPVRVAVNVSACQFVHNDFFQDIQNALDKAGLDARWLEIELTESALMQSIEKNIQVLDRVRELRIQVAIDDFGTGYSSLNYLKQFKVNSLKIDKTFIRDLPGDLIANTIIQLAHGLGLTVVAEGVEHQEQLDYLQDNGCEQVQGFLIAKPLPPELCIRRYDHA